MPEPTSTAPQPDPSPTKNSSRFLILNRKRKPSSSRDLLESAGIDSDLKSIDAVQDAFPGVGGSVILVREEDAEEAEDYRVLPPVAAPRRRRDGRHQWMSATSGVTDLPSK